MIDLPYAMLLGLVQGLTEFIPISSTAHLRIVAALLNRPDPGAAFSAVIQLGTLASLLVYFRADLINFTRAVLTGLWNRKPFEDPNARLAWQLVLGTIPISVAGLLLSDYIKGPFRSLYVIAGALIVLAVVLYAVDRLAARVKEVSDVTWRDALLIGFAQAVALIPGASRSGTTLTMGLALGYSRYAAMRFSFLLSIPAIGLSGLYELYADRAELAQLGFGSLFAGSLVAAVSGYIAVAGLLRFLRTHSTLSFALYRIALGALLLVLLETGIIADA
jgi:undecaprenyl-diphosphatase